MKFNKEYKEKVVGTSFYKQDMSQFPLDNTEIPTCTVDAYIVPEPNNKYDSNAKRIEVVLSNNTRSHIGYLKRDGELYRQTKAYTKSLIPCKVVVMAYSVKGIYDSYKVIVQD